MSEMKLDCYSIEIPYLVQQSIKVSNKKRIVATNLNL